MLKLALVFGTRPEEIKLAPLVKQSAKMDQWETKVIVTGQHREMLDQVLQIFEIEPDYDLEIMSHGQSLSEVTQRVLQGMDEIFENWKPDLVLVHGDTSTAFAAALAAFYRRIPVGHVEAGLRTRDVFNPFPEEANRRLVDAITTWYFAPTKEAKNNLLSEDVDESKIFVTGNTVIDALLEVVEEQYTFTTPELEALDFEKPIIVVTAHRRENWGEPLEGICEALLEISGMLSCKIVVAMHRNPSIQNVMKEFLSKDKQIVLIDAPNYKEFANLLARSTILLTDSGGLQEEAPALNKPVLVMRTVTERPEAVQAGTVKLIGSSKDQIVQNVSALLTDQSLYEKMSASINPYGDGTAAQQICDILNKIYK